jgi:hypothetical protein
MKKLFSFAILSVLSLSIPTLVFSQSSKEAYRALKKLEAKIQAGISYKDYGSVLGDAKLEVNLFSESAEAKEKPKLKEIFNKTMGYYEEAGNVWNCKFAHRGYAYQMVPSNLGGTDSDLINQILRSYPKARFKISSDGLMAGCLPYNDAIKIIWQEASDELKKANPLIK